VAMTAHAMAGDRERCLVAGMDAYVSKPIRPGELLRTVDGLAAARPAQEQEGPATDATPPDGTDGTALNQAALLAGFGGNRKVLREVIEMFLTDAPHLMGEIQRALQAGDQEALASSAHALKGSVGLFVQVGAFDTVRQLERTAKAGDSASTAAVFASLESDMRSLQNALNIFRQQLDS